MESFGKKFDRSLGGRQSINVATADEQLAEGRAKLADETFAVQEKYPETVAELQEFFEAIDHTVFRDVFAEYLEKSGISRERLNVNVSYAFVDYPKGRTVMAYHEIANTIVINVPYFESIFAKVESLDGVARAFKKFLHGLAHEHVHAFGYVERRRVQTSEHNDHKVMDVTTLGFDRSALIDRFDLKSGEWVTDNVKESSNILFNEGITELIAQEVVEEYARRVPDVNLPLLSGPIPLSVRGMARENIGDMKHPYSRAERVVIAMTDVISEYAGVPQEKVWQALVRQYFSGEASFGEIAGVLDEVFGEGFWNELGRANTSNELGHLVTKFQDIFRRYPHSIDAWLQHLDLSRGAK